MAGDEDGYLRSVGECRILKIENNYVTVEWRIDDRYHVFTLTVGDVFKVHSSDSWFLSKIELELMFEKEKWQRTQSLVSQVKPESEKTPPQDL